jgi:hypothetical protein
MGLNSLLVLLLLILFIMKIFIENYPLSNLTTIIPSLKKYLVDTKQLLEITSIEGQYYIDESKVYKKIVSDKDAVIHKNYYKDFNLLIDYSYAVIIETNQIPNHNIEFVYKYYYFALNKSSKLKFVIQTLYENTDEINNIIPIDFYFETEEDVEINNIFFKDEINVFLSLLN